MLKPKYILIYLFASAVLVLSCEKILPQARPNDQLLDGPVEGLTAEETQLFLNGDALFNGKIFTAATGLGPGFVATSCAGCHAGDGKGHPSSMLTRFGQGDTTGNKFLHLGGPQLQNRSIPGFKPERIPDGAPFAKFLAPSNTGLGFLELVSDQDILLMADANDADGDGISGVPNWKPLPWYITPSAANIPVNGRYIHRFGKKAGAFNLLQQTVNAYNQDMGILSLFEPKDPVTGIPGDAEVSQNDVQAVVFYLRTLKAPIRRNVNDAHVLSGEKIFLNAGCEKCHKQTLKTGNSTIAALDQKIFHPYTDLLLHDMGPEDNDGYTEGVAMPFEWRTAPLWGLGLSKNSQGGVYFLMHDGRANSIESAIEYHGGEASASRTFFRNLSENDRRDLILFLESL